MIRRSTGVWILGDLADDDRSHGMGVVVEYAGATGKPGWVNPEGGLLGTKEFGKGTASRRPQGLQSVDDHRRGLPHGHHDPDVSPSKGPSLPGAHAQCER